MGEHGGGGGNDYEDDNNGDEYDDLQYWIWQLMVVLNNDYIHVCMMMFMTLLVC